MSANGRRTVPRYRQLYSTPTSTLWLEFYAPLLLWCGLVQYFSSDAFSYSETSGWLTPALSALLPFAGAETLDLLHQMVRKLSHVAEFFVMGWLVLRSVGMHPAEFRAVIPAVAFVVILAGVDEWHQAMTLTRGPSLVDVGYDCLGGAIGIGWTLTRSNRLD